MEYQQLDFARFETRFLRLVQRPKDRSLPIRFELVSESLSNPPEYSALSYCWGDISQTSPINIDDSNVQVSKNLADAFYHCGLWEGSLIWADAICINQSDLYEKSYQVNLMGQTYSKAGRTIVWLGMEHSYSRYANKLLELIERMVIEETRLRPPKFYPESAPFGQLSGSLSRRNVVQLSRALRLHDNPVRGLHGLHELFKRPYWERVWIVQESAKTRDVEVRCGELQLDLELLLLASRALKELPLRTQCLLDAIANFRDQEQRSRSGALRMTLMDALVATRHSLATESRDKVFALLDLTRDGGDIVPIPSYTENIDVTFKNLTLSILEAQQKTNILLLSRWASQSQSSNQRSALWTIDWADLAFNVPPWLTTTKPDLNFSTETRKGTVQHGQLNTRGRLVGIVEQVEGVGRVFTASPVPSPTASSRRAKSAPERLATPSDLLRSRAGAVMQGLRSDILGRMVPGEAAALEADVTEITDVLSRMIRDAEKGFSSLKYDFDHTRDILERLGGLMIHNNPVREWARQYNSSRSSDTSLSDSSPSIRMAKPVPKIRSPRQEYSRPPSGSRSLLLDVPSSPKPSAPSLSLFRVVEDILDKLDPSPEYKLRFATVQDRHVVLVCDNANPEDEIYEIEHCLLPVVLRRAAYTNAFILVGEACVGRHTNGDWLSGSMKSLDCIDPETQKTPEPRPLVIDLEPRRNALELSLYRRD